MRFNDLSNKTFGLLTVIKRDGTDSNGHVLWSCRCVCGKEVIRTLNNLYKKNPACSRLCVAKKGYGLIGKKFGKCLVLSFNRKVNHNYYWLCRCDCGKEKIIREDHLKYKRIKSCGCSREKVRGLLPGDAGFNQLLCSYKKSARRRGLEFNLSNGEFKDLVTKTCFYCGSKPSTLSKNISDYSIYIYNGIDRVDNLKGYFKENCVTACTKCNRMKLTYKSSDFVDHCILIHNFQKSKSGV